MFITKEGNILGDDQVARVDLNTHLKEVFSVRVCKETKDKPNKLLLGEQEFEDFPTPTQILFCIQKFGGDMASVVKVYKVVRGKT